MPKTQHAEIKVGFYWRIKFEFSRQNLANESKSSVKTRKSWKHWGWLFESRSNWISNFDFKKTPFVVLWLAFRYLLRNLPIKLISDLLQVNLFRSSSFCRTWGQHVVYKNCSECQKQFLYTTCSPQVWVWNFHVLNL